MMETQETVQEYVQGFVIRAREAQAVFEEFTQEQVDQAVCAVGKAIYDRGEELAELAVEETGMGIVEDIPYVLSVHRPMIHRAYRLDVGGHLSLIHI